MILLAKLLPRNKVCMQSAISTWRKTKHIWLSQPEYWRKTNW